MPQLAAPVDCPLPAQRRLTPGKILRSLRAFSLPVSVLPVLLATAAALPPDRWHWPVLLASVAGVALLHLGGNLLNDYFDFRRGVDRPIPNDEGRPGRLLVHGQLLPRDILIEALVCLVLALAAAGLLWAWRGPRLLWFGIPALVLLYSYTGPPLRLKYHALGELVIFVVFGPLLMAGAAWAQTGALDKATLLMSLPVGLATTAILIGNNYRDRHEDSQAGILTLAQFAHGRAAPVLYLICVTLAAVLPAVYALLGRGPRLMLAAPLTLALLAHTLSAVRAGRRLPDIDVRTARFETVLLIFLIAAWLLRW